MNVVVDASVAVKWFFRVPVTADERCYRKASGIGRLVRLSDFDPNR